MGGGKYDRCADSLFISFQWFFHFEISFNSSGWIAFKKKWLSKRERKREVDSLLLSNKWKRNVFCYPLARHETARNAGAWPPDRCHGEYNDWCCCYIVGRMALSVCPNTLFPDSIGQRCWIGFSQVVLQGSSTEKAKGVSSFINFQLLGTKQIKIDEVIE